MVLGRAQLGVDLVVEAGQHGALEALVGVGHGVGAALPVEELVHVEDPEVGAVDAFLVDAADEDVVLVGGSGGQDPLGGQPRLVVCDDLVGHHVADGDHHVVLLGKDLELGLEVAALELLPGNRAPLEDLIGCEAVLEHLPCAPFWLRTALPSRRLVLFQG